MNVRDGIRMFAVTCAAAVALAGRAETACVRIGYPEGAKGVRYETRTVELEKTGDASWRFILPKAEIPRDAKCVEVVPSFMTARRRTTTASRVPTASSSSTVAQCARSRTA